MNRFAGDLQAASVALLKISNFQAKSGRRPLQGFEMEFSLLEAAKFWSSANRTVNHSDTFDSHNFKNKFNKLFKQIS